MTTEKIARIGEDSTGHAHGSRLLPSSFPFDPDDRRLEDWIVRAMDDRPDRALEETFSIEGLLTGECRSRSTRKEKPSRRVAHRGWARIRVTPHGDLRIVRILGKSILRDLDLDDLAEELGDLARAGYHRLVLDFQEVEKLTSRILSVILTLHRRCRSHDGGMVRVCGLRPIVVQAFVLSGLTDIVPLDADLTAALNAPWPAFGPLNPLPIAILNSMREIQRETYAGKDAVSPEGASRFGTGRTTPYAPAIRLRRLTGEARGRSQRVLGKGILIGRDPACDVRIEDETVSRRHARILVQGGSIRLRDLGSTNGTFLNDERLADRDVELREGDSIRIGSVSFQVGFLPGLGGDQLVETRVAEWLGLEPEPLSGADHPSSRHVRPGEPSPPTVLLSAVEPASAPAVKAEVVEDVLVVAPQTARLDEPALVDAFRDALQSLLTNHDRTKVVLDLSAVSHLSSRAIGILVVTHLRLDRVGGALRLCHVPARVHALLERVQLPMLLASFVNVEDAVLSPWN